MTARRRARPARGPGKPARAAATTPDDAAMAPLHESGDGGVAGIMPAADHDDPDAVVTNEAPAGVAAAAAEPSAVELQPADRQGADAEPEPAEPSMPEPVEPEPTERPPEFPEPEPEPELPGPFTPEPPVPTAVEPELAEVEPEPAAVAPQPTAVEPEPALVRAAIDATPAAPAAELVPLSELGPAIVEVSVSRRVFLGFGLTLVGGLTGAAALTKYVPIFSEPAIDPPPIVSTYDPVGKAWTFVVDSAACIGCGLCVVACKEENSVTQDPEFNRTWVERHAVARDGTVYIDAPAGGAGGFPAGSTATGAEGQVIDRAFFEPRLCMQCENSPCTSVCPVGATYRTADGIILVDSRRCIGCGYCVVACPYGARYIAPAGEDAPNGTPGVADKCTWCYHRISRGGLPACVDICPVGARKFGDASDPDSEIATIVRERAPKPLHPEFGTRPRVLYLGPAVEEA